MRRLKAAVRTSVPTGASIERHEAGLAGVTSYLRRRHGARARQSSATPLFFACQEGLVRGRGRSSAARLHLVEGRFAASSSSLKLVVPTCSERRARDAACQDEHSPPPRPMRHLPSPLLRRSAGVRMYRTLVRFSTLSQGGRTRRTMAVDLAEEDASRGTPWGSWRRAFVPFRFGIAPGAYE